MSLDSIAADIVAMRDQEPKPSFAEIGQALGISRQRACTLYNRARTGNTAMGRTLNKDPYAEHIADVRVNDTVHAAAMARIDAMAQAELDAMQRDAVVPPSLLRGRPIALAELCRRIVGQPLDPEEFPQKTPFRGRRPGSRRNPGQVVRFRTVWGWYSKRYDEIHARGYSVAEVVEDGLKKFARTGVIPPGPVDNEGTTK